MKANALLSFANLIDSPLPYYVYMAPRTTSPTRAALRLKPIDVKRWTGLKQFVLRNREQIPSEKLNFTPLPPNHYREMIIGQDGMHKCWSEGQMYGVFEFTLCSALNQLFNNSIVTSMPGNGVSCSEGSRREDFTSIRQEIGNQQDPQNPSNQGGVVTDLNRKIVAVWEVKTDALIRKGPDLVSHYAKETDTYVKEAIYQLVGHHISAHCKYGFITTYICTWATFLDSTGILYISDPFFSGDIGFNSVLNMAYYVLCRANAELDSAQYKPPHLEHPTNPRKREKAGQGVKNQKLFCQRIGGGHTADDLNLTFLRVMVKHVDRITWQARLEKENTLVAVKCYADDDMRDREVTCYQKLRSLQAISIPYLIESNVEVSSGEHGRMHALLLSWIGGQFGGNYITLPTKALLLAGEIISKMHKLGVAHGDVRAENMNYNFTTGKLFVYDFSESVVDELDGKEAFEKACEIDNEALDQMIAWSRSEEGQNVEYVHWAQ